MGNTFKIRKTLRSGTAWNYACVCENYDVKVGVFYKKSTEWNFEKNSQNTYLDPVFNVKKFQKILIHKSCEKSESLKKQPENTTFSHFPTFLKIYELTFSDNSFICRPSVVYQMYKFLGKFIRQISRSRYVLLSHNRKMFFANQCENTPSPCAKFYNFWKVFPMIQRRRPEIFV